MTVREQRARPAAKINLTLAVGPRRPDGLHELVSVMQRVDLRDDLRLGAGPGLDVTGFREDTIVREALGALARTAGTPPCWHVRLEKGIPLAAGLGGGSADAAAALSLASADLDPPLSAHELKAVAAAVGSDVPFFLEPGPKLVEGAGERLTPLDLPQDYWVLLALEEGAAKQATADVYARFDARRGEVGFDHRAARVREIAVGCRRARDLALLPRNDLAGPAGGSALPGRLREAGAFRADLSGAGPAVYALFDGREVAEAASRLLPHGTRCWIVKPVW